MSHPTSLGDPGMMHDGLMRRVAGLDHYREGIDLMETWWKEEKRR
jgi:hypothetical protein